MVATSTTSETENVTRIKVINSAGKYYAEQAASSAASAAQSATNAGDSETACLNYKNATYEYMGRAETAAEVVSSILDNVENINVVAGDLTNIDAVASKITEVDNVADDLTNINAVADELTDIGSVAGNITNINTVAGMSSDITSVISNATNIDNVADDLTNINAVASNLTNINAVNSNKTNIDAVAGAASDISAVVSDLSTIEAVAADLTNIDSASSNASLAKDWANKMNGTVDGSEYSAKYYAQQASQGQVQSNWAETDTTAKSYIQNKPDLSNFQNKLVQGENIYLIPKLEYVANSSNTGINTGIKITQDGFELDVTFYCSALGSMYLLQSRDGSGSTFPILGISGSSSGGTITLNINGTDLTSSITRTVGHIYHVNGKYESGTMTLTVDDLTAETTDTKTGTYTFAANSTNLYIFSNSANQNLASGYRIYGAYCKVGNNYAFNYFPALNTSDAPCFYDTVSNAYITATTGSLTSDVTSTRDYITVYGIDYNSLSNKPTIPTVPTALSSFTDDLGSSPTHTHSQYELINKNINVLATSGTVALTDNSVNTITPSAAVTFTLPTVTDNTKFHQILVQVNMSTVYSIDLGLGATPHYFNKTAPDMSNAGVYNLIFEYDKANQYWVGGCIAKGAAS